ncbi:MAG: SurA N-terminal domain-containing protein [Gammaproteobacteria bacterium AqS3]|nr:SurA N-terminal domain-containing protein [Gammaproteobacteria bacterium AqS3]
MLQRIRSKFKGVTAAVVLGFIAVPFVLFFGAESYFFGDDPNLIAQVDGEAVTSFDLDAEANSLRLELAESEEEQDVDENTLREDALRSLLLRIIERQNLDGAGLRVTDRIVARYIAGQSEFKDETGRFSSELYNRALLNSGRSDPEFRSVLGSGLRQLQVSAAYLHGAGLPPDQLERLARIAGEQRSFRYIPLYAEELSADYKPTPEEQKAHYEADPERYTAPEERVLRYIDLNYRTLASQVPFEEDQLRDAYERRVDQARSEARVRASAIVLLYGSGPDAPRSAEAAAELADELKAKLEEGADFAELAREHSDDDSTAEEGGDLGWSDEGGYTRSFLNALQDLKPGELGSVDTSDAQVLLRLEERESEEVGSYEEELPRIRQRLVEAEGRRMFDEQYEILQDLAFESDSFTEIAGGVGLAVITSDPITEESSTELAALSGVVETTFALEQGEMSRLLEVEEGRVLLLELAEITEERPMSEEEARDQIIEDLTTAFAEAERDRTIESIRELLVDEGLSFTAAVARLGLTWESIDDVDRFRLSDPALAEAVFGLEAPEPDAPAYDSVVMADGSALVFELTSVKVPEIEDTDDSEILALIESGRARYAQAYYEMRTRLLMSDAEEDIQWFNQGRPAAPSQQQ